MKFLIWLFAVGGLQVCQSAQDAEFQAIDCSFYQSSRCFNVIANLGGNFTAKYAENEKELNATCQQKQNFEGCIKSVPPTCYIRNATVDSTIGTIIDFVTKICTNKSKEQNNFLNSSVCYNKYQQRRAKCESMHATTKRDSKSLCCKSFRIQKCLKSDLSNVCPKNSTEFQDKLIDTYSGYTNFLCGSYKTKCNGSATNYLSLFSILIALKLYLMNFFR